MEKEDLVTEVLAKERCIRQYALTVARNAKFLSSQAMAQMASQGLSTVRTATRRENQVDFNFLSK